LLATRTASWSGEALRFRFDALAAQFVEPGELVLHFGEGGEHRLLVARERLVAPRIRGAHLRAQPPTLEDRREHAGRPRSRP
jgi:hypothetical protein